MTAYAVISGYPAKRTHLTDFDYSLVIIPFIRIFFPEFISRSITRLQPRQVYIFDEPTSVIHPQQLHVLLVCASFTKYTLFPYWCALYNSRSLNL